MVSNPSRIRGSLYGTAVVDALGGPVEFRRRGTFAPVTSYRFNATFGLKPGTWTDDTSTMLCLAQSLVDTDGKFVIHDQIRKYVRWYQDGYMSATGKCFDIGNATRQSLDIWREAGNISALELRHYQNMVDRALTHERACGNGSLMRCAPIPLIYHHSPVLAQKSAALASTPTHPHPTCQEACQVYTHLITLIMTKPGITKAELFTALQEFPFTSTVLRTTFDRYKDKREEQSATDFEHFVQTPDFQIKSSGYVVHTLEAALWAFLSTLTFQEGALKVVNLGDDADTVGAVYGGLSGAWYGIEAIPNEWIDGLQAKSILDEVAGGVVKLVEKGGYGEQ